MGVIKQMATARQLGSKRVKTGSGLHLTRGKVAELIGRKALDYKLNHLATHGGKKAARAGINAGLVPLVKALRAAINAINATDVSPKLKRQARKTVGKRFAKAKGGAQKGQFVAKAGFAVGKKKRPPTKTTSRGVGVGVANIHWFVLGTDPRYTKKGHHHTGQIRNVFDGVTRIAFAGSAKASVYAARVKIASVVKREAMKNR